MPKTIKTALSKETRAVGRSWLARHHDRESIDRYIASKGMPKLGNVSTPVFVELIELYGLPGDLLDGETQDLWRMRAASGMSDKMLIALAEKEAREAGFLQDVRPLPNGRYWLLEAERINQDWDNLKHPKPRTPPLKVEREMYAMGLTDTPPAPRYRTPKSQQLADLRQRPQQQQAALTAPEPERRRGPTPREFVLERSVTALLGAVRELVAGINEAATDLGHVAETLQTVSIDARDNLDELGDVDLTTPAHVGSAR